MRDAFYEVYDEFIELYDDYFLAARENRLLEEIGAEHARVLPNGKIVTTDVGW